MLFKIILSRWHWILGSLLLALLTGYCYLCLVPPLYETNACLKFEDRRSELSELTNVRNLYDRTNKVESEKQVVLSRRVLWNALISINANISYYSKSVLSTKDLYPKKPVKIVLIKVDSSVLNPTFFEFRYINTSKYQLCYRSKNEQITEFYSYEKPVSVAGLKFKVILPNRKDLYRGGCIFKINTQAALLEQIRKSLKIDDSQDINILNLKLIDRNPHYATDILNAILTAYISFDKEQRSVSAQQTTAFISSLLQSMSNAVHSSGNAIQHFKEHNKVQNLPLSTKNMLNKLASMEAEKQQLDIQSMELKISEKILWSSNNVDRLNYNLQGITDPLLNNLLSKHNDLVIKKTEALNFYTRDAPFIKQIEEQIATFKGAIIANFSAQRNTNTNNASFLSNRIDSLWRTMDEMPQQEKNFISLQSRFDVDQKVYSYLAEKELEAKIAQAAVVAGAVTIDRAVFPIEPLSPQPLKIYTLCAFIGLATGLGCIFLIRMLNPYIYQKEAVEQLTAIPIIGIIRNYGAKDKHQIPAIDNPRSLFSESLRYVRSNLSFLASGKAAEIICITSEVSGEGKSFISVNLACMLTLLDKNVLLIAADLRKSTLHEVLHTNNQNGLSSYLSGQTTLNKILTSTQVENLDFIPSGPVPPNPSELLHNKRMIELLVSLKNEYDFIVLDSAPIGMVTDGNPLIQAASINLFILRYGISKYEYATTPDKLKKKFGLTNIAIILNDFKEDDLYSQYYVNNGNQLNHYYYGRPSNYTRDYLNHD